MKPSSLYIHIPFCEHKCIYCDFYSIAPGENGSADHDALVRRFLSALERELRLRSRDPRFATTYDTVFFGGGTPSLLEPSKIRRILELCSSGFSVTPDAEVTLETNPGTVSLDTLIGFSGAGVNRISVGIQSFHEDDLKFLTRIHSSRAAEECVRNARAAGFENISVDLIFSLPGQTVDRWRENLERAMSLEPDHISCYSLIVEPNTPLQRMVAAKQVTPLPQEEDASLYEFTIGFLADHGYQQYEVSNFCKPGYASRHNQRYWDHSNYIGFGPSAHSFWNGTRWWNISNVNGYAQRLERDALPVSGEEVLTEEQQWEEEIFLGLRSTGIELPKFRERYGKDLAKIHGDLIDRLVRENLAASDGKWFRLTSRGYALCDEICTSFTGL